MADEQFDVNKMNQTAKDTQSGLKINHINTNQSAHYKKVFISYATIQPS
jgi:hypothetical protein